MKKILVVAAAMFLGACNKKHDDGSAKDAGGMIPGNCVATIAHYQGAVTAGSPAFGGNIQTIQTNANVIDFHNDRIDVSICKNTSDCTNRPAQTCAAVWNQASTPCYTTTPSTNIIFGRNVVQLKDAAAPSYADAAGSVILSPGYSSYAIDTTICR